MLRACIECGAPTTAARCPDHARSNSGRNHKPGWKKTRALILARDNNTCHYCGQPANTVDHVIPAARGGQDTPDNLVACCAPCNASKGDREAPTTCPPTPNPDGGWPQAGALRERNQSGGLVFHGR